VYGEDFCLHRNKRQKEINNRLIKNNLKKVYNPLGIKSNNHYFCRPKFKAEKNG